MPHLEVLNVCVSSMSHIQQCIEQKPFYDNLHFLKGGEEKYSIPEHLREYKIEGEGGVLTYNNKATNVDPRFFSTSTLIRVEWIGEQGKLRIRIPYSVPIHARSNSYPLEDPSVQKYLAMKSWVNKRMKCRHFLSPIDGNGDRHGFWITSKEYRLYRRGELIWAFPKSTANQNGDLTTISSFVDRTSIKVSIDYKKKTVNIYARGGLTQSYSFKDGYSENNFRPRYDMTFKDKSMTIVKDKYKVRIPDSGPPEEKSRFMRNSSL